MLQYTREPSKKRNGGTRLRASRMLGLWFPDSWKSGWDYTNSYLLHLNKNPYLLKIRIILFSNIEFSLAFPNILSLLQEDCLTFKNP
jgi:hypothetical protein